MYDFSVLLNGDSGVSSNVEKHPSYDPRRICVENYITHNGDFDFYDINGKSYDLEIVQKWLEIVTGYRMPAVTDSCAVAGIVDLLRTQGCFGLSARFALCFGLSSSKMEDDADTASFPTYNDFDQVGMVFGEVLNEMLKTSLLASIDERDDVRQSFASRVVSKLEGGYAHLVTPFEHYITDQEDGASLLTFATVTIHAFFDNDLLNATKIFMKNATGSFGLCVTSSLDANRQICLAARGQTISIAFYPDTGLICYGSEQAAVKAGMNIKLPGGTRSADASEASHLDVNNDSLRLDLDDLNGEICLIDWGRRWYKNPAISKPNRNLIRHEMMNDKVDLFLFHESMATTQDPQLYHRMTHLMGNIFIKPLEEESDDLVLKDIRDIPKICRAIQEDWRSEKEAISLNRLTALNLSQCLRKRLEAHVAGTADSHGMDILLTGCEVSLWLAEQFASDMQKAFPKLRIQAVSSNKLLGLYGQEVAVPSLGFPFSPNTHKLDDTIVIIVSHSGGTFGPLACSSLFQGTTNNFFVVTSEWDTQIGKQLRNLNKDDDEINLMIHSRIFTTEVGLRPAEPCSVSVAATHQLLTTILEYISGIVLSDHRFRRVSGAVMTEQDLQILEKCNQKNVAALCNIVGASSYGKVLREFVEECMAEKELRAAGNLWAEHVLENAKAYIMTIVYIFVTVVSGYPLVYAIAYGSGFDSSDNLIYLIRVLDAAIYLWLPQINVTILRLFQRRNLLHRMVGRTVVIGDIPWVAQSAEAFLSKIFAVSYSIAGLNVLSGNPADHFVHRHTHRVVRGSLVVCGRPDGRLSALSTAESSVCLSVNQASSIQSLGGTCESITIGHNPFKLPLSANGIFLPRQRPLFLCERMLNEADVKEERSKISSLTIPEEPSSTRGICLPLSRWRRRIPDIIDSSINSFHREDRSHRPRVVKLRSSAALLGAYMNFDKESSNKPIEGEVHEESVSVAEVIENAIHERKWSDKARKMFNQLDKDGDSLIEKHDFITWYTQMKPMLSLTQLVDIFDHCDEDGSGRLDFHEYLKVLRMPEMESDVVLPESNRDSRGIIQVEASREKYFGEAIRKINAGKNMKIFDFNLARNQHFSQELYESRIASLQRFVAMTVMFHQMGRRVELFFRRVSFGLLGYRMDRTHSIMRIATTASPVSGADVRQRMRVLQLLKKVRHSIKVISVAWLDYKQRKVARRLQELEFAAKTNVLNTKA